jgi:CheY-like chemotaxis protein
MKIAVIDDSTFSRNQIKKALTEWNQHIEVVQFPEGSSALEFLKSNKVDLITLDLVMPSPSGFDVLAKLREWGVKSPIVIISADIQDGSKRKCIELGCDGFLEKPINAKSVQHMMERLWP